MRSYYLAQHLFRLPDIVEHGVANGIVAQEAGTRWLERLRQAGEDRFFASVAGFAIRVTRPARQDVRKRTPELAHAFPA